jgi:hypothetical protein
MALKKEISTKNASSVLGLSKYQFLKRMREANIKPSRIEYFANKSPKMRLSFFWYERDVERYRERLTPEYYGV